MKTTIDRRLQFQKALRRSIGGLAVLVGMTGSMPAQAQTDFQFSETIFPGYDPAIGMVSGVAAADFDADGDIDVFVPNREGVGDLLLLNDGAGGFTNVWPRPAACPGLSGETSRGPGRPCGSTTTGIAGSICW